MQQFQHLGDRLLDVLLAPRHEQERLGDHALRPEVLRQPEDGVGPDVDRNPVGAGQPDHAGSCGMAWSFAAMACAWVMSGVRSGAVWPCSAWSLAIRSVTSVPTA